MNQGHETQVAQVNEHTFIVDRPETRIVGIGVPVCFESRGYGFGTEFNDYTMNDYFIARKHISDGTVAFLAETIGVDVNTTEIVSARYDIHGDGNYKVIVGIRTDAAVTLPEFLPEHTEIYTVPAGRYAKMLINERQTEGRTGYPERMHADEYFVSGFRKDTPYVYDISSVPMNTYDLSGDMLAKYEPVKIPAADAERFDSIAFSPVTLPSMKIACSISGSTDDFVIFKYFKVQDQVNATGLSLYYLHDYYGFPLDASEEPEGYKSAFGARVIDFDGLPDCVSRITLPGGLYIHVTQREFNGDNPSIPYEVAFNHMDALYFSSHPAYEIDWSRKVIARFRQANCASVFVPVKLKS